MAQADSQTFEDEGHERVPTTARPAFVFFMFGEAVALVVYMYISRPMWFFLDEWDFLAHRTGGNISDLFRPHNEHWVTLPLLVYRALWWIVGLRSYRPYQLVIVLLHLGAALLIWVVMRRAGVRPWTATVVASILVFFGSGYQNIVLPFQMTLVGSLVLGLAHLLLAGHDGPFDRRDYYGIAAGLGALMCSGVGVSMVIAVGVAVLIARGWRLALLHTAPLAALYVAWYAAIGHEGFTGYHASAIQIARFVRLIVAATFGAVGHYTGVGIVLGALLVGGLVLAWWPLRGPELRRQAAAPLGLLVGGLSFLLITGLGRAGLSAFAEKSRFLHLLVAMLLPALAVAADAVMRRWRVVAPVVVVLLLVGIPGNVDVIVDYMHRPVVKQQAQYRQLIESLPRVPAAKEVSKSTNPENQLGHFVTIGWLLSGAASGRISKPSHISAADEAMDTIRLSFKQLPGRLLPGVICDDVAVTPLVFHLTTGQTIFVRARNLTVKVTPVTTEPARTYPFLVVTVAGATLEAQRPVAFRMSSSSPFGGRVCAPKAMIRAARAAANAT